jgi:hypothetical protein
MMAATMTGTKDVNTVLAERAQKRLTKAIKLLRAAQAEITPGGPYHEVTHALNEAYAAWRILTDRYGLGAPPPMPPGRAEKPGPPREEVQR